MRKWGSKGIKWREIAPGLHGTSSIDFFTSQVLLEHGINQGATFASVSIYPLQTRLRKTCTY